MAALARAQFRAARARVGAHLVIGRTDRLSR
jgi:hypothetical protein